MDKCWDIVQKLQKERNNGLLLFSEKYLIDFIKDTDIKEVPGHALLPLLIATDRIKTVEFLIKKENLDSEAIFYDLREAIETERLSFRPISTPMFEFLFQKFNSVDLKDTANLVFQYEKYHLLPSLLLQELKNNAFGETQDNQNSHGKIFGLACLSLLKKKKMSLGEQIEIIASWHQNGVDVNQVPKGACLYHILNLFIRRDISLADIEKMFDAGINPSVMVKKYQKTALELMKSKPINEVQASELKQWEKFLLSKELKNIKLSSIVPPSKKM